MFIVYRRWGILVAIITFGCCLAANWAFNRYYEARYYEAHNWTVGLSLVISAAICLLVALALPNRRQYHLFFIPMLYWAPLLAVIGVVLFLADPANPVATKSFSFPSMSAPAPEPSSVPVSTAQISNATAVAAAQKAAIQKYPALGNSGSSFNSAFVGLYKLYQKTNPGYFDDPAWPLKLADETAKFVK